MRLELALEAAAADSVYIFLTDLLLGLDNGVGSRHVTTATELFIEMKTTIGDLANLISMKDVPGNARAISPRIVQASSLLEKAQGWRVSRGRNREFIFEKVEDVEVLIEDVFELYKAQEGRLASQAGI